MTSKAPPIVSPASLARSMAAIIRCSTSASTQRSGLSSGSAAARSNVTAVPAGRAASPRTKTWLVMLAPARASNCLAMAPAATRAAVSRALARSRTSRTSVRPYLATPARSACPGRGRVTGERRAPPPSTTGGSLFSPLSALSAPTRIVYCQFGQSRFSISIAIGPPIVSPARTPDSTSARSDSIAMRRPRP